MPDYTIRWTNRSIDTQDWQIDNGDAFQLLPDFVRSVDVTINANHTYAIAVATVTVPIPAFSAANLTYDAPTQIWTLNSNTPNEWQLATGNGLVTVRCLLRA